MFLQMCQRICSSFLLTQLFLLAVITIPRRFSNSDCHALMTSNQCQCSLTDEGYKIQCPTMVLNLKIKMNGGNPFAILTCNHFDDEEYQPLPVINIGDIYSLRIEDCLLPNKSISHLLGIQDLRYLTFKNDNLKSNITREHLKGLSNLILLDLHIADLSVIREDLFMDLLNLESLFIYSSKISLTRETFAALGNLKSLKLEVSNLQQLPVGIFHNQRMLETLELLNTPLPNISKDSFAGLTSLKNLFLIFNGIETLVSDVFSLLTNLIFIDLSSNNFEYLPSNLFAHNNKLNEVFLFNSTSLKALPPGLFANLLELHSVFITSDTDSVLGSDTEELFARSESKVLINCGLNKIPHDLFISSSEITKTSPTKNTLSLDYLDLSHNRLQSLSKELFDSVNQLTLLKLSYNFLTEISSDLFSNLTKLTELYLNNNCILTIAADAFYNNNNLRSIYMENNRIEMTVAFRYLPKLQILNLRNNTLRHIFKGYEMYNLIELDLSHNFIASLNYDDLPVMHNSSNLFRINLNFNRITKINMTSELLSEFFDREVLLSIQLNNNPVDCDCNLLPLLQYVRSNRSGMVHFETSELACKETDSVKNLHLSVVDPKTLLCPFNFKEFEPPHCPLGCACWERTFDSLLLVDCNNLTEVQPLPRVQPLGLESIELHVENNELIELPLVSTAGYEDVTRIYAARNKISHLNVNSLPEHLVYLDLSRNNLKGLNKNVLNFFRRHSSLQIALSGNPWNCDCGSKPLMQFVTQRYKMITDIEKVYCDSPNNSNMVKYFTTDNVCQDGQDGHFELITSVVTISVVCLAAVTAALYYKYQTEIKILMYKYKLCSWWVNEEELDKDKTYDAFVSYSSRDDEFVLRQLVPELENGSIRFKLCIHVRDFIVGGIIPDQIIRAIADSRRTIIVLSVNFIQSVWARMEFRLAHQAGLNEKRTKVIVIVYGEIGDISSLDLELQAYLKMTTYLEWGNPWFWDRLRYIMPHRIRRNDANELELNEISVPQNAISTN